MGTTDLDASPLLVLPEPRQATANRQQASNNLLGHIFSGKDFNDMQRAFEVIMLSGLTIFQMSTVAASAQQGFNPQPAASVDPAPADVPALPPLPRGKSTVLGGQIQKVDPVRDQITLGVYGQKPVKILFDERTELYRDGSKIPLHDLSLSDHASVQTTLDGTNVFAVSIHMLSQSPEGEYQGRVSSYNPTTGEMTIESGAAGETFRLLVTKDTSIIREGQRGFTSSQSGASDLEKGALVSVKFESNKQGRGLATQVAVLAVPGSEFVYAGNISSLDMHAAFMVLMDPRDDKSYQIFFDPARLPTGLELHVGDHLRVVADYDGTRYMARDIAAN